MPLMIDLWVYKEWERAQKYIIFTITSLLYIAWYFSEIVCICYKGYLVLCINFIVLLIKLKDNNPPKYAATQVYPNASYLNSIKQLSRESSYAIVKR